MAFRKAIGAEAFELLEDTLGEFQRIAALLHALKQLGLEFRDIALGLEGRHGPAQLIGLRGREACAYDGDAHSLLLKQRDTERLAEHPFQLFGTDRIPPHGPPVGG